eukprot:10484761-Lingulodinium_polyedra.AAC.1
MRAEIAVAEDELRAATADVRARRGRRGHRWVQDALADGGGRLYKWIRAGGEPAPGLVPDPLSEPGAQGPGGIEVGTRKWITALRGGPAAQL